ncbi:uncharacterized protein LOC128546143 [Mercenaria mercenaria]|uniref:uncharacterized protein LOC128546143 n=1 Tax=Mercenaria mercenaria TaxID=6596 RepID=UPI00234F88B1|nr:uncharacterized protein LOC128546143 [Mercenaria mercenaria]
MDYPYAKSRKKIYRASNQGSNPDRMDATRKNLGETQRDDSNDYGFDWLNGGYNWEASRREEYGMSRRDVPEDWDAFGATMRDDTGNRRRDNLGRTMKENLGATRRVDLGATGDTRREDFGASAADGLRATGGNPYRDSRYGNPEVPYYRQVLDTGNYGASRSIPYPTPVGDETTYPTVEPYDYAVKEGKYSIDSGQETAAGKPRRWTSVAADKNLMEEWHTMFGQIRTKWAPSSGLDDPATVSKWSDENSSKDGDPRMRHLRLAIIVAVVAAVVLVAVIVPTLLLTLGKDEEKEVLVQYEFKATITNREYSADMADRNSDAFKNVENEFCDQLDQNAANKNTAGISYDGCSVKEIKNGSLIIIYIIVIRTSVASDEAPPAPQQVSTVVGITVAATDEQTVGVLTIVTVEIEITVPTVITENENPVKKKIQFNGTCSGTNKERCVTKHSECIERVCKCPVDRTHDSPSDKCTQIDCGDEPVINNGTVTSNGTKYGSTLNITCDEGFELSENATINCSTPGTWGDMPLCMPMECPEFITPNNSEIDSNTTGRTYTDIIEITCITGYELDSSLSTVTCLANQSWSESPVCSVVNCNAPDIPVNTIISWDKQKYEYNESVTVECYTGFQLEGNATISCQANGTWEDIPKCSPVDCEPLIVPDNAVIVPDKSQFVYQENVTIECDTGYQLQGNATISCQANGTWKDIPKCSPVDCEQLTVPDNAAIVPDKSQFTYQENVILECDTGYQLQGNATIGCQDNGTWINLPECQPVKCEEFTKPDNAAISPNKQQYEYNDNITIECNDGYKIQGENMFSCLANGSWTDVPTCTHKECDLFVKPENAEFTPNKSQFLYSENVTIKCNIGYEVQGIETISCKTDGTWIDVPICSPVKCELFDVPNKAKLEPDKKQYTYSETVTLECKSGYEIQGNSTVRCQENASWTEIPTCKPIDCSQLQLPEHTERNLNITDLNFDDAVFITCENGFILVGDNNISCHTDGTWPTVNCVPVNCSTEDFAKPDNSMVSNVNDSDLEIECVEGYIIDGNPSVTCTSGNWSEFPRCNKVDCGAYGFIENGNVSSETGTEYKDTVEISCIEHFRLIGKSPGICLSNGSWTDKPECTMIECGKLKIPKHAVVPVNINDTVEGTVITLVCRDGYDLNGNGTVICQANENWSDVPMCEAKDCGEIDPPENGNIVNQSGSTVGMVAFIECDSGFDIVGKENVTCLTSGKWGYLPSCLKTECGKYTPPDHTNIVNNTISCEKGYNLSGDAIIECLDGNWSVNGKCDPVQCSDLPEIDNANSLENANDTYLYEDTIDITCYEGFEISGDLKAKCSENKTWVNVPSCSPVPCNEFLVPPDVEIGNQDTKSRVFGDIINITCSIGFELEGDGFVICNASGDWETYTSCKPKACPEFAVPQNAEFERKDGSLFVFGDSVIFSCEEGYNLTGNQQANCTADGEWTDIPSCRIVSCKPFQVPQNASVGQQNLTGYTYGDALNITCDEGHFSRDGLQALCGSDGEWKNIPVCVPVNCSELTVPNNANIGNQTIGGYKFGDVVQVSCHDGFSLSGVSKVECLANGTWGEFPSCEIIDCGPYEPRGETYTIESNSTTTYNTSLSVTCVAGLELTDDSMKTVSCEADGQWHGHIECKIPGSVSFTQSVYAFDEGDTGRITCEVTDYPRWQTVLLAKEDQDDSGITTPLFKISNATGSIYNETLDSNYTVDYTLENDGVSVSLKFETVTCGNEGLYTCAVVVGDLTNATKMKSASAIVNVSCTDCGIHEPITNTYVIDQNGETKINSTLPVTCVDGLELTNESVKVVTCEADGKWHGKPDCAIPGSVSFTQSVYAFDEGDTGRITCEVTDYPRWQTVLLAKEDQGDSGTSTPLFKISNATGFIYNETLDSNYTVDYTLENDGVSVSLKFETGACDNEGLYTCTVVVGDHANATEMKSAGAIANVSCTDCGIHEPITNTYMVDRNGESTINSTLPVTCVDGLELTNESVKVVTCEADGKWHGEPDCAIPGSVSFTQSVYAFDEGDTGRITCEVTDYPRWQTVLLAKEDQDDSGITTPLFKISNATGSIYNETLDSNYTVDYTLENDGVSVSLKFETVTCGNEGLYTCAVVVGDLTNATKMKSASAIVNVSCTDCGIHEPITNTYVIDQNGETKINSTLPVTCVDGLELTNESVKVVTCEADGKWHGKPDCAIPGSVSFTQSVYAFDEGDTGRITCEVTDYPRWQTVLLAKEDQGDSGKSTPLFKISNATGFIYNETLDSNYTVDYTLENDGVSVSLKFETGACDNEGLYTCAVVVGDHANATEMKFAGAIVNVSCTDCGIHEPITNKYVVNQNGETTINSTLPVTCVDGLELTNESVKVVTCEADGEWHGEPDCAIPGSVSFTQSVYAFDEGDTGRITCEVTDYPRWQTVLLAKEDQGDSGNSTPLFKISNATGFIYNETLDSNYTVDYTLENDGVSVSLKFETGACDNEGLYTCAVVVGDHANATEMKFAGAIVNVSCTDCGIHEPITNTYVIDQNGETKINSTLPVTCVDGLELTNESVKVVTCEADGKWHGKPDCAIPGSVSFTQSVYAFDEGDTGRITCEVTDYPRWQTVLLAKEDQGDSGTSTPLFKISNATGFIYNETLDSNYTVDYTLENDGVSVSLKFETGACDNEGLYTCTVVVGDHANATEMKSAGAIANVSCTDCGIHEPITNTYMVDRNGESTINSTLPVTCVDGLELTNESVKVVTCEADGKWHGEPDCTIPGSVSFTQSVYAFDEGDTGRITCEVTDYPRWQTVLLAKEDQDDSGITTPLFKISNATGPIYNETLDSNYTVDYTLENDGVSVSLKFETVTCGNEGLYTCAVVVGDLTNATKMKSASAIVNVSCTDCGIHEPITNTYVIDQNGETKINSTLPVTCVDGLELTNESVKVVTCEADGKWHGKPDCAIPGSVSFTQSVYAFDEGDTGRITCEVTDYPRWQTVLLAKEDQGDSGKSTPLFKISNATGFIYNETLDSNYTVDYTLENDGVSVSLKFETGACDNEGLYTCAVVVGDHANATEMKFAGAIVNVSCTDCGIHEPITNKYVVNQNGETTINSTLPVTCVDGLELTNESVKVVTCEADGEWHGEPDCAIPGSVSFIQSVYAFDEGDTGRITCEVTDYPRWQIVLLAKEDKDDSGTVTPLFKISNATGSIYNETLDSNYTVDYTLENDGVSFSLKFETVVCDNEGLYTCAVVVGDPANTTEMKSTDTIVNVSCTDCGIHEPITNTYVVNQNGKTTINSTMSVTCVDGLELANGSVKVVTCEADGNWHGEPDCAIPGSLTFTEDSYTFKEGTSVNITCQMKDNPNWKTLMIGKVDDKNGDLSNQIFTISNVTGFVENTIFDNNYNASYTLNKDGASISLEFDPLTCSGKGIYMCAAIVGEFESPIEINNTSTTVNISTESKIPEITIPDKIYLGREANVECTGLIGKGESGQIEGRLMLETNFGDNGSNLTYNGSATPEDVDCYFKDSISVPIPTSTDTSGLWAQCVIRPSQGDDLLSVKEDIHILASYVAFENNAYVFNIGEENASFVCDVENIPDWGRVEIRRSDGSVIIAINSSDQSTDSNEPHISLIADESNTTNDSVRLVVVFGSVECSDALGGVGDVEYACVVMTDNKTTEARTTVTFQRPPQKPHLTLSRQIIEGQPTWAGRTFICEGGIGNPPGHIEVESNFDGEFGTLLAPLPGENKTSYGFIVDDSISATDCGFHQTLEFALENITKDYMHQKYLRCVTKPSDDLKNGNVEYSEQKLVKVVPTDFCVGKSGYVPHPYFCHLRVLCDSATDGKILGVPEGCKEHLCYNDASQCVECSTIGGRNVTEPTTSITTTTTTPSPNSTYMVCDNVLTGTYDENVEVTCSLNNIDIDLSGLTQSPVTITADNSIGLIFDSSRDNLTSNSFSTTTANEIVLDTSTITLKFVPLQCQHIGIYTFKYSDLEGSSEVEVVANVSKPAISKQPDQFYRNQEVKITCGDDVGRPKGNLVLKVKGSDENEWADVAEVTKTENETASCTTFLSVTYVFFVDDGMEGQKYICEATGANNDILESDIETVTVLNPVVYFMKESETVQIGNSLELECVLEGNLASSGAIITRNSGNEHVCDVSSSGSVTCSLLDMTGVATVNGNSLNATITINTVKCEDEGTYYCESVSDSSLQALTEVSVRSMYFKN